MKSKRLPPLETVLALFDYDPEAGVFTHRAGRRAGKVAGEIAASYRRLAIGGKFYYAHRIAWLVISGEDPLENQIDHINGDRLDNRSENLRVCTSAQNCRNSRIRSHNTSGFKGVSRDITRNLWQAGIVVNGKRKTLGRYATRESAYDAYCAASKRYHAEFGRVT